MVFPSIGGCDRRLYVVCRYGPIEGKKKVPYTDNRVIFYRIALLSAHRAVLRFTGQHFPPKIKEKPNIPFKKTNIGRKLREGKPTNTE